MVEITEKRLKELERIESKLMALEAGGVDNWEGYCDSLSDWFKANEVEELVQDFISEFDANYFEFVEVDYPAGRDAGESVSFTNDWNNFFERMIYGLLSKYDEIKN